LESKSISWWASLIGILASCVLIGGWAARSIAAEVAREEVKEVATQLTAEVRSTSELRVDIEKRLGDMSADQREFRTDINYIKGQIDEVYKQNDRVEDKLDSLDRLLRERPAR